LAVSVLERIRLSVARAIAGKAARSDAWLRSLVRPYESGRPAAWADDPTEQVKHFRHWVFAAIRAIANRVAATPLTLYRRVPGGEAEEVTEHPFLDLLNYVNPFHTRFWLWAQTVTFLELTGNAYWYVPRNRLGVPAEIWVAHSHYMHVIPDREKFIAGYEYRRGTEAVRFEPDEIVHLKYPNPESMYYGRGPLQAAAETVDAHESMKTVQFNMMKRGAFPGGALEVDGSLTEEQLKRLRAQFEDRYTGRDNSGRWVVLEAGMRAKQLTLTPQELAFVESAGLNRDEILAIYGVPAAVVGLSENVNKAVADAMDTIFARYTIAPKLQLIEDQLNQDLIPRFDDRLFVRFDSPVPEDEETRRTLTREDFKVGIVTLNEARAEAGYEEVPGGDRRFMSISMVQVPDEDGEVPSRGRFLRSKTGQPPLRARPRPVEWFESAFLHEQGRLERRLNRALRRHFSAQERRVLADLSRLLDQEPGPASTPSARERAERLARRVFDLRAQAAATMALVAPFIEGAFRAGVARTLESLGLDPSQLAPGLPEPRSVLEGGSLSHWVSAAAPDAATLKEIAEVLHEYLSRPGSRSEVLSAVRRVFSRARETRAPAISRREIVAAFNAGGHSARSALAAAGVSTWKVWVVPGRGAAPCGHGRMHGARAAWDEPFTLPDGLPVDYPGSKTSAAHAEACRCTCATEVQE